MKNLLLVLVLVALPAFGDNESPDDKTITVRKGTPGACVEYQIVEGTDEIFGAPDANKQKAYGLWSAACEEWKRNLREMNKENQVIAAGCKSPKVDRDDANYIYRGTALYKVKTRIRESAK